MAKSNTPAAADMMGLFAAFLAEQGITPEAAPAKVKPSGGRKQAGAKATAARKPEADKQAYKPTAAKRKEAATARQLWALNQAGLLILDVDGGHKPLAFGAAFDCIAATRKG